MILARTARIRERRRHPVYTPVSLPIHDKPMTTITSIKAYDVRGRVPEELNEDVVYRIGRAYARFVNPRRVPVGRDIRFPLARH